MLDANETDTTVCNRGDSNIVRRPTYPRDGFIGRENAEGIHVTSRTRRKALHDGLAALAGLVGITVPDGADERPAGKASAATDRAAPEHRQFERVLRERAAVFDCDGRPTPGSAPAVPITVVCQTAHRHDWTDADVEGYIETLEREGRVYEPCVGWIAIASPRE